MILDKWVLKSIVSLIIFNSLFYSQIYYSLVIKNIHSSCFIKVKRKSWKCTLVLCSYLLNLYWWLIVKFTALKITDIMINLFIRYYIYLQYQPYPGADLVNPLLSRSSLRTKLSRFCIIFPFVSQDFRESFLACQCSAAWWDVRRLLKSHVSVSSDHEAGSAESTITGGAPAPADPLGTFLRSTLRSRKDW